MPQRPPPPFLLGAEWQQAALGAERRQAPPPPLKAALPAARRRAGVGSAARSAWCEQPQRGYDLHGEDRPTEGARNCGQRGNHLHRRTARAAGAAGSFRKADRALQSAARGRQCVRGRTQWKRLLATSLFGGPGQLAGCIKTMEMCSSGGSCTERAQARASASRSAGRELVREPRPRLLLR